MPASTPDPDTLTAGDEFVVEAPSVEAAVADVVARTGRQPEVLEVDRVAKGGIGGFFAKEVARVRVRLGEEGTPAPAPTPQPTAEEPAGPAERIATAQIHGVEAVLAAMTADADAREVSFGEVLRRELSDGRDPLDAAREHAREPARGGLFAAHPRAAQMAAAPPVDDQDATDRPATAAASPKALTRGEPSDPDRPAHEAGTTDSSAPDTADGADTADNLDALAHDDTAETVDTAEATGTAQTTGTASMDTGDAGGAVAPDAVTSTDRGDADVADRRSDAVATDHAAPSVHRRMRRAIAADQAAGPAWSMPALYRLGLPASLLDRVEVPDDATDGSWLAAVARAVAPLCGALPTGTQALIGPDADLLGQALSLPVTTVGDNPPYGGDVALVATDRAEDLNWVDRVMGDRWRHVVVSDREARGLVSDDVEAVSWVGSQCLPEAIGLALTCGLVLGHGLRGVGSDVVRATPLDVAIGLRDLLPRIEHRAEGRR